MEDKRTAIALFICIAVIYVYTEMFIKPLSQNQQPPIEQTSPAPVAQINQAPITGATDRPAMPESATTSSSAAALQHPSIAQIDASAATKIASPKVQITITHLGARIRSYKLVDFKANLGKEDLLDLVSHIDGAPLPGGAFVSTLNDDHVVYTLKETSAGAHVADGTYEIPPAGELSLTFTGTLPNGPAITKTYKFGPQPYLFSITIDLAQEVSGTSHLWIEWPLYLSKEQSGSRINPGGYVLFDANNKINHVAMKDVEVTPRDYGANKWVSLSDKYFMASVIPAYTGPGNTRIGREGDIYYSLLAGETQRAEFSLYVGPKESTLLTAAGHNLDRNIDLGWFAPISYPLLAAIHFFYGLFNNYGLAIILLTLLVKLLFLPLTKASFESMRKMQDLQPEMAALRERIKDATQLNKEVVELYRKRGVNPLGGCLPVMIQLPVFLGLYNALMYAIELRHAHFALWINDLSDREALQLFGFPIPIMVLIMGASMYLQQLTTPQVGDPQQQRMMKMMPLIFTAMFLIFPVPAGLTLYWLVNNIISIVQQMYLRGHRKANPYVATVFASLGIFAVGYILTLL